jgi:uncharacterized membrane protein required for colicin V production
MHILIDAILIIVFALTVIHYYRIGFVKALISVCKLFVSLAVAFALATHVGSLISEKVIYKPVLTTVTNTVEGIVENLSENADASEIVDKLPESFKIFLDSSDVSLDDAGGSLAGQVISDEIVSTISGNIAEKISKIISNVIAFLILFAVSMIALTILAFVLDKLCMLPILKQTNKVLGIIFGVFSGAFNVFAACTVITLILHLIGVSSPELSAEAMKEKTIVYSLIENIDMSYMILTFLSKK